VMPNSMYGTKSRCKGKAKRQSPASASRLGNWRQTVKAGTE
jgi:hypothetical protein